MTSIRSATARSPGGPRDCPASSSLGTAAARIGHAPSASSGCKGTSACRSSIHPSTLAPTSSRRGARVRPRRWSVTCVGPAELASLVTPAMVRRQDPAIAREIDAWCRHQGGQTGDKISQFEYHGSRTLLEGVCGRSRISPWVVSDNRSARPPGGWCRGTHALTSRLRRPRSPPRRVTRTQRLSRPIWRLRTQLRGRSAR